MYHQKPRIKAVHAQAADAEAGTRRSARPVGFEDDPPGEEGDSPPGGSRRIGSPMSSARPISAFIPGLIRAITGPMAIGPFFELIASSMVGTFGTGSSPHPVAQSSGGVANDR